MPKNLFIKKEVEEEWWQHTPFRSSTPSLIVCDLTPSTRKQTSEQEYSYLMASKRHPSTPDYRMIPQSFSQGIRPHTFPRSTKYTYTCLECSQDFLKICWRLEICSVVLRVRRKPHWISSGFGSIIFADLGIHSSWEAKQKCSLVVGSFTCLPFCVWGWKICQSFGALPKRYATWHARISPTIRRSKFP